MSGCSTPVVDVRVAEAVVASGADIPGETWIVEWVERALDALNEDRSVSVSVSVVDEEECRRLNRDYRNRDRPTNVLSFPMEFDVAPPPGEPLLLGDIVICAPVVAVEARAQAKPAADHWAHLLIHGMLHLAGHDHENDAEAEAMERLETAILARGGVADPYIARISNA